MIREQEAREAIEKHGKRNTLEEQWRAAQSNPSGNLAQSATPDAHSEPATTPKPVPPTSLKGQP